MVDKLSLLWEYFWKLSTVSEREKIGDHLWFDNDKLLCLICCSWWPDSLFLAVFIYRYRHIVKWLPLSITKILHFNHWFHSCDQEAEVLIDKLFWSTFEICYWKADLSMWKLSETILRKQRQLFFTNTIQKFYSTLQSVSLCLWHNLNDRIENSFLHIDRGSWLKGIVNMSIQENKWLLSDWMLLPFTVYRPLLNYTKQYIESLNQILQIPFIIDVHNWDSTQKRILLRNTINNQKQEKKDLFYTDRTFIYSYWESLKHEEYFFPVFTNAFRPTKQLYCTTTPVTINYLQQLLSRCGLYTNISEKRLHSLLQAFTTAQSFYLHGRRFLQRKWQTFFCFTWSKSRFWEECIDHVFEITALWKYEIGWCVVDVNDSVMIWWIICFPHIGDKFWSISFTKRAAKQHIPFFWRRSLPIVKKNNKIVTVFTNFLQ